MGKARRELEPRDLHEIEDLLTEDLYGVLDLVTLNLCPDVNFVNTVIRNGLMKFCKINSRSIVLKREQIIEYFREHVCPKTPLQPYVIQLAADERAALDRIEAFGRAKNPEFCALDFFRNMIQIIGSKQLKYEERIYKTNGDSYDRGIQHPSDPQRGFTGELFDRDKAVEA